EFQALQSRANLLGFPDDETPNHCTLGSSVSVSLVPPATAGGVWKAAKKKIRLAAAGRASGRTLIDHDNLPLICRPAGDGTYSPRELYAGTFDRIAQE